MKSLTYIALAFLLVFTSSAPMVTSSAQAASSFSCADVTEIPQTECEALVALYNSTNGPGWTNNTNWLVTNTPSNWYGVIVISGNVTQLSLDSRNLIGSIPSELGNLTSLNYLSLGGNQLNGSIPTILGNLTGLTRLDLGYNQLTESIPVAIGNLTNLIYLNLSHNQLSGSIPVELGSLVNLKYLYLWSNQLSGSIPDELGNLTNLEYLYLWSNQLSGSIPTGLGSLNSLKYLELEDNQLSGSLPAELGNLTNLYQLELYHNHLTGNIPAELGNLTSLEWLQLNGNHLSGSIPSELGNLANLIVLWLQNNHLSGDIPSSFINLVNLYDPGQYNGQDGLDLDYNMLNVPPGYPAPGDPLQVFLHQKDPDWQLYQGFKQIIGTGGGSFTSLDGRTDLLFPAGALDGETTFTFMPHPQPTHNHPLLWFAHNSFDLSAEDSGGNPVLTFNLPVTVTLTYSDTDISGIPENRLELDYWEPSANAWTDAVTTCPGGEYTHDLAGNRLVLPVCHLTEFGLFGEPVHIFLPVVRR